MARVLVVDDDPLVCQLIQDILQEVRFEAVCVDNDDVNLGCETTGFDEARFARQIIPSLPVLYITGEASEEALSARGVPCSGYLQKPFGADELLAALVGRLKPGEGGPARPRARR
jgi:CheY-like chemotaxis protein